MNFFWKLACLILGHIINHAPEKQRQKQKQAGTKQGLAGTNRDSRASAGTGRNKTESSKDQKSTSRNKTGTIKTKHEQAAIKQQH